MLSNLLSLDLALEATWKKYIEVLKYPEHYPPEAINQWLEELAVQEEYFLGFTTNFLSYKAAWHAANNDIDKALSTLETIGNFSLGPNTSLLYPAHFGIDKPRDKDGAVNYAYILHAVPETQNWIKTVLPTCDQPWPKTGYFHEDQPLSFFQEMPLPLKTSFDVYNPGAKRKELKKGDMVYLFRRFSSGHTTESSKRFFASIERFNASEEATRHKENFLQKKYTLEDFVPFLPRAIASPHIRSFFNNKDFSDTAIIKMLQTFTAARDGFFTYKLAVDPGYGSNILFADNRGVNCNRNGDIFTFLWILNRCGRLEALFSNFDKLPEDFPLLLMCFNDAQIRKRVEKHMKIPGLQAMYELALSPKKINVKDQLRLIEFGHNNPHFQELLAASLYRYGYHLYNQFSVGIDWYLQGYETFSKAAGGDILCFITSRANLLPQIQQILEFGPGTEFAAESVISEGYRTSWVFFLRAILCFLALQKADTLDEWIAAYPLTNWNKTKYRQVKLFEVVEKIRSLKK